MGEKGDLCKAFNKKEGVFFKLKKKKDSNNVGLGVDKRQATENTTEKSLHETDCLTCFR